jgi:hypothetical protein
MLMLLACLQALPPYEKVVVGTTKFGMRSTQVSPEFEAITHSWSQQLLGGVAPCSPSYFHFVSHRGSPVLLGVRVGQMHTEHFAAKFLQQYAPGGWGTRGVWRVGGWVHRVVSGLR